MEQISMSAFSLSFLCKYKTHNLIIGFFGGLKSIFIIEYEVFDHQSFNQSDFVAFYWLKFDFIGLEKKL